MPDVVLAVPCAPGETPEMLHRCVSTFTTNMKDRFPNIPVHVVVGIFGDGDTLIPEEQITFREPFTGFGDMRTHLYRQAQQAYPDAYIAMCDVDDQLMLHLLPEDDGTVDVYNVHCVHDSLTYSLPRLFLPGRTAHWTGRTHEYLNHLRIGPVPVGTMIMGSDSERRNSGRKTTDDIRLLTQEIDTLTKQLRAAYHGRVRPSKTHLAQLRADLARWQFYLANTYRDQGNIDKAIPLWQQVAGSDHAWIQERYVAAVRLLAAGQPSPVDPTVLIPRRPEGWLYKPPLPYDDLCHTSEDLFAEPSALEQVLTRTVLAVKQKFDSLKGNTDVHSDST